MGLISSLRKKGVKGRQLGFPLRKRAERGEGKEGAMCGRQANEWLRGREWGIRHMAAQGLNFPAISMTPGLILIGQDTSPNPLPVLFSVWSPLSSIWR